MVKHDRMDWFENFMPLPKELDLNEYSNVFRNPNGTNSAELNQNFYHVSFTFFDRLSFQVQIKNEQTPFTVM